MDKQKKFFELLVENMCKRWGADFVILFCRYELGMTDKELKGIFNDEDVTKSKRFNKKNYKESVELCGGNIFNKGYAIYFGGKQIF